MFVKLFKHDFNANIKLLSILSACALGIGCICGIIFRLMESLPQNDSLALLSIPAAIFLIFGILAIVFFPIAVWFMQLLRFYKSRFTDLGYLTFTLPVKTWHIFMSSALNLLLWSAIGIAVSGISLFVMGIIGSYETLKEIFDVSQTISGLLFAEISTDNILTLIFYGLGTVVYSIVEPLFAIILGCTIAKKHKAIATIGIMYGMSFVTGILNGIVTAAVSILSYSGIENGIDSIGTYMNVQYSVMGIIMLGLSAALYPLSIHMMKTKLNLP